MSRPIPITLSVTVTAEAFACDDEITKLELIQLQLQQKLDDVNRRIAELEAADAALSIPLGSISPNAQYPRV